MDPNFLRSPLLLGPVTWASFHHPKSVPSRGEVNRFYSKSIFESIDLFCLDDVRVHVYTGKQKCCQGDENVFWPGACQRRVAAAQCELKCWLKGQRTPPLHWEQSLSRAAARMRSAPEEPAESAKDRKQRKKRKPIFLDVKQVIDFVLWFAEN